LFIVTNAEWIETTEISFTNNMYPYKELTFNKDYLEYCGATTGDIFKVISIDFVRGKECCNIFHNMDTGIYNFTYNTQYTEIAITVRYKKSYNSTIDLNTESESDKVVPCFWERLMFLNCEILLPLMRILIIIIIFIFVFGLEKIFQYIFV
jgi:hypothetical protein